MFCSCISLILFENSRDFRERSSVAIYLLSNMYQRLKLNRRIYVNQRVIKISERSAAKQLN